MVEKKGSTSSASTSRKKKKRTAAAAAAAAVEEVQGPAIGIDLGTTYSCVAVWQHDRVEIITNQGQRTTSSPVSFTDTAVLVGDSAVSVAHTNALNTVYGVKRLIGRRFSDPNVQKDIKQWPFRVVAGCDDRPMIVLKHKGEEKEYCAEEISSMVLMKMKDIAESYFHCTIKDAVITVPAYFNDSQRRATKLAGAVAGLNVKRIMDEPTAAALAYGFDKIRCNSVPKNIFVFDLGGGTFDVSLVNISGGVFEVKATAGDTHLGGEDFDNRIVDHFVEEIFKGKHKKDIRGDPRALRRLRSACERAKRTLSTEDPAEIFIDHLCDKLDFSSKLSRAKFEELNEDLFSRCIELSTQCLTDAKIDKSNVDYVVLVGGSSRIPKVQQLLRDYFGIAILRRNVHPDEAVAYGAAVQAAKLSGQGNDIVNKVVLIDVTPLSLGLATNEDIMKIVVPRNTPIPTKGEKVWTTVRDNQIAITFKVYEGERLQASANNLLGKFRLSGINPAPRGVAKSDVCFEIVEDGILSVSAKDRGTSQTNAITIKNEESWLRKDEIDKMIRDAKKYRMEDEDYKRKIHAREELDNYAYDMRNTIRNRRVVSKVRESKLKKLEEAISQANCWLDENKVPSVAASRAKLQKLKEVCEPIVGEMDDAI